MDTNYSTFGFDQPAFDSQDFGGPFNAANGFNYDNPALMGSFDDYFANMPLNGLDQSGSDLLPMGLGFNSLNSGQPNGTALSTQRPMNKLNQPFSNTYSNDTAQFGDTTSSNGSDQPNFTALSTQRPMNILNQPFSNTSSNGTAQFSDTTYCNDSGEPALSSLSGFDKPNSTTPLNHSANPVSNNLFSQTTPSNGSRQSVMPAPTSFDKPGSITVNGTHQFSDTPSSNGPCNAAQSVSNNVPLHAPYRQVSYDPSIPIPYTPEDTDADKVRKWENLIAHANLANAGVPASASQIIQEETCGQSPKTVSSPNSLFDSPRSASVEILETPSTSPRSASLEILETPSTSPPGSSPPDAPAATMATAMPIAMPTAVPTTMPTTMPTAMPTTMPTTVPTTMPTTVPTTMAPPRATMNVTAPATLRTVQLPRALANEMGYAQHVSPFAPVTVHPPGPSTSTPRDLEKVKLRIQGLVKERNYYQRTLRKATSVDAKTGKTALESLQAQNNALRRTNSKLARDNEDLKQKVQAASQSYTALVEKYNHNIQQLHKAQLELKQLGK
ncbi:uncharacterized protein PGRI_032910 [Penicillium griseofulvum]|uniref:Uncharacterized protein n=1 Tax=Penicillium patulum TaxID=5078 RepID=A0A135L985_PENPA|nr:uncharacterized protein PGRI_032910 [Penicillium griseofulvum]KXG45524.1 hypothetical protein PGRI_032910 [Penicillium griseofulvum]